MKNFSAFKQVDAVKTLILVSDYACRQLELLKTLLTSDDWQNALDFNTCFAQLQQLDSSSFNLFSRSLRQFRHRQLLSLLLREMSGLTTTIETMTAWSACADAIILRAIAFCSQELGARYGQPCDESGAICKLYVLAMGKLGGRELNYSSDIDLIFAYSSTGHTNGEESISNQQYYTKVVQRFLQLLQTVTAEGFVFRVDLRLRPNGESGALVSSLAAMETYYQEQGRDWERYAMVKARLIGENTENPAHWFHRLITPFVYRRYVDFSVIESLRSMKAMIEREVQLNPMLDDIKRGFGGIREVEFIVQNLQLIRGGRLPELQQQNTIAALTILGQKELLPRTSALKQAYLFLRKLENVLQSHNDQQTHALPNDALKKAQIALAMGYSDWKQLEVRLHQYQRIIGALFSSTLGKVQPYEDERRLLANQLMSLWQGHVEKTMAVNLLASLGFQQAERCYQMIHAFRHAPRCRRLTQAARIRLDRFMVLLLNELTEVTETDTVLLQVIQLLENIVGRSSYLALLTENPQVLKELLYWFANSAFITSLLVNQPFLLEVLLEQQQNWRIPSRKQLEQTLKNQLDRCSEQEQQEELLRQFKLVNWLSAARAEMYGRYSAVRISRFLTDIAEVIVAKILTLASNQLSLRYPQIKKIKSQFAIIAYGKLGGREMNYNSDLDLVFVHKVSSEEEALVTRLTQKILHMLTTRSQAGILYSVDTRLRPSGEAGLLVSHIDAFIEYQLHHAWIWEHQALIRARFLVGDKHIHLAFKQLKKEALSAPREKSLIFDEVVAMRQKIARHASGEMIKYTAGGLIDLEFLVQFLVLIQSDSAYTRYTHTLSLLQKLFSNRVISQEQFSTLKNAYKSYHHLLHRNLLQPDLPVPQGIQTEVMKISNEIYSVWRK
ncbi:MULTISPECIES: bifunctional [glutamate--ammonia ligase]-adenylyl-L-tyrosine phosphorylase/[glutamate--ammonia-ligase] adenylyltransferase [unclassified Legionella]|uniref:bifunctional [glutamate--ammonia ligase]-adenylyl-L-tyrosine phosphorylase/[glutamate--ammonia-ligase] adenylyltransferase n=1 Tax=unclassified Legionella TaxID=2622702 RepID=UPI001F5EF254|nr:MULTISPECIES: bifunctional [glutamate--ammonia ligase]-adenylyl-L-tyrosine phosphorylase/[glutamate--ammonia-ligase] adenylyltransferase [unclassified Legionella]MDI9818170.1 bifunctional [glutamate--ammonia ligase]-adenylyl-L-tyrosine phosphorylase/[glutamate--ammonia-ligase] adenylyltransferase [Legionella sp. PL877]